jgi:hypothetical protein
MGMLIGFGVCATAIVVSSYISNNKKDDTNIQHMKKTI